MCVCAHVLAPGSLEGRRKEDLVADVCPARFVGWVLLLPVACPGPVTAGNLTLLGR